MGKPLTEQQKADRKAKRLAKAASKAQVTVIEQPNPEIPQVVAKPSFALLLVLVQDTFKITRKNVKGEDGSITVVETPKEVKHDMEFAEVTTHTPSARSISNWLIAKLTQYQLLNKLQGKKMFDMSLPIQLSIKIDGQDVASSIKFSIVPKTLERILADYPLAVSAAFNPATFTHGTKAEDILKFRNGLNLNQPLVKLEQQLAGNIAVEAAQQLIGNNNVVVEGEVAGVGAK